MGPGGSVEGAGNLHCVKASAHHFGGEFADASGDGTGDKDFHDVVVVVVDGHIEVLSFERNLPGGAEQLPRPVFAIRSAFGFKGWRRWFDCQRFGCFE